jgi:hypothetical protein
LKKKSGLVKNTKLIFNLARSVLRNRRKLERLAKFISKDNKSEK